MNTDYEFKSIADQLVASLVGKHLVHEWWHSPNRAFDMLTPEQEWAKNSDGVINYLMSHAFTGGGT